MQEDAAPNSLGTGEDWMQCAQGLRCLRNEPGSAPLFFWQNEKNKKNKPPRETGTGTNDLFFLQSLAKKKKEDHFARKSVRCASV